MKPNSKQSLHSEDNQIKQAGNDFMKTNCNVRGSEGYNQLLGEDKDLVDQFQLLWQLYVWLGRLRFNSEDRVFTLFPLS